MHGAGTGWALPDVLLRRAALRARLRYGRGPDPLAGLRIDDEEVLRLVARSGSAPLDGLEDLLRAVDEEVQPELSAALEEFRAALNGDDPLARVVRAGRLEEEEAAVLALLVAVELDAGRQRLVAYLNDDVQRPVVTVGLLDELFRGAHPGSLVVAPGSRLDRTCLVEVAEDGPLWTAPVRAARSVAWTVSGATGLDPALPPGTRLLATDGDVRDDAPLVLATGGDRQSRLELATGALGRTAVLVARDPVPGGWSVLVREATLRGAALVVELDRALEPVELEQLDRADHLAVAVSSRHEQPADRLPRRPFVELAAGDVGAADAADRHGHRLGPEQWRLVQALLPSVGDDLDAAVRRLASGLLEGLATRIRPRRGWDDLVLREDQKAELRGLADRYRYRPLVHGTWGMPAVPSSGVVALFVGPSGTGKTMAAEVVAGDLGLDLYKVDLSSIVSKYIGETEKQLEQVFQAATAGNLVLFFDEADALFGKRSEVNDAKDRYANIETSYLLQRIESYDGFVILASNLQANIDDAFLRRIHAHVRFEVPGAAERRAIWTASLPPGVPLGPVDLDLLARVELTGGAIRSAALAAAFLAASSGSGEVLLEHLSTAVARELRKLGRLPQELTAAQTQLAPPPAPPPVIMDR